MLKTIYIINYSDCTYNMKFWQYGYRKKDLQKSVGPYIFGAVGGTWTLTSVRSPPPQDGVSAIPPQPRGIQKWCLRTESNCRHTDFQSVALPTELPRHEWRPRSDLNWRSSPWQGDMLTATPRGRIQSTCLVYRLSELLSTLSYNIFDEFFFIF